MVALVWQKTYGEGAQGVYIIYITIIFKEYTFSMTKSSFQNFWYGFTYIRHHNMQN